MPYAGIPPEKTKVMEKCINDVMARGHTKDSAIAICHASIMGEKKKPASAKDMAGKKGERPMINLNFYGDYWKDRLNDKDITVKADENSIEEIPIVEKSKEEGGETENMKTKDEVKVEKEETKKQAAQEADGNPAAPEKDDEGAEMKACMKAAMADGKSNEEAMKACKAKLKEEDKEEEKADKSVDAKVIADKAEKPAEVEQVQDVNVLLKGLIEKIDKLVQKQDANSEEKPAEVTSESTPAEGATPEEKAPVGGTPEAGEPKEAAPKAGATPEGAEVQKAVGDLTSKVDGILLKITEKVDSFSKSFEDKMKGLADRVNTLEEQPVPSKVATRIVSKTGNSDNLNAGDQERLDQVLKELGELESMQKDSIEKYQAGRYWEKAIKLVDEKNALLIKKATGQSVVQI